jgi:hypothetical protein
MMEEQTEIRVRVVDESGNPWALDVGARYLLDLRAVMYTGFRIGWDEGVERAGGGVLIQKVDPSAKSTSVLPFAALPREPDRIVPWESNLVYEATETSGLREVVVPTSAVLFEGPARTFRGGENQLVQIDLITFHDGRGEPIRLPDHVRRIYAEQMRTVNSYGNCAEAAAAVEQYGVDRAIEENLLETVDVACATLHVIAPFVTDFEVLASRSIAVPGPPIGGEAILRIALAYDLAGVSTRVSDYYQEIAQELPDPGTLEDLDNKLMELICERFFWADSSEEAVEEVLQKVSPLVPA